jgi:cbb3-type cytochrome oxidase subunit 3
MNVDVNLIRNIVTLAAFGAFIAIVLWSYAPARKARLEEAGRSILEDGE